MRGADLVNTVNDDLRLFTPTDQDYANGYTYMEIGAQIATNVGIDVGTMGMGCAASVGSRAAWQVWRLNCCPAW